MPDWSSGEVLRIVPSYQAPNSWLATVPALFAWIFSFQSAAVIRPASTISLSFSSAATQAGWLTVIDWPSSAK